MSLELGGELFALVSLFVTAPLAVRIRATEAIYARLPVFALLAGYCTLAVIFSADALLRRRLPSRALPMGLYVAGYACIAAALILDPIVQPPLFVHGFVPGIGAGLIVVALALVLLDLVATRRSTAGSGPAAHATPPADRTVVDIHAE